MYTGRQYTIVYSRVQLWAPRFQRSPLHECVIVENMEAAQILLAAGTVCTDTVQIQIQIQIQILYRYS